MEKESILKAKQQSDTKDLKKAEELARTYIRNKATHYVEIVRETGNYWRGFNADCFKAAEIECLKNGSSLEKS